MVLHCAVCHKLKTLFPALPRESPDHRAGAAAVAVPVAAHRLRVSNEPAESHLLSDVLWC